MSASAPQVLSRRAKGMPHAAATQSGEAPTKAKASNEGNASRSGKGRGSGDKQGDASTNANGGELSRRTRTKAQDEGDKLIIRRLPPGMTEAEFVSILGPDWEVTKGKVDWVSYSPGKVSNDPSKPSRPSRAYLHLLRKDDILALSEAVRGATWEDAKSTFNNPSLVGPPALEFSAYKKVPGSKKRTDPRQGTIDQDQEFMTFLEGLANPVLPRESIDVEDADVASKDEVKVTTTPLVEFLKEKKANKGRDGGSGKGAKSASGKGKGGSKDKEDDSTKKRGRESKADKSDKASKETVKILTKKAATEQAADATKAAASQLSAANAADAPKSRRAGIAAAARILQRDLGLSPGSAHRRARHDAAKAGPDTKSPSSKDPTGSASEAAGSPAEPSAAPQSPKSRPESPVAQKSQPASRRTRGGKAAEKSKVAETSAAQQPTATNPPVILKKKGDTETPQATAEAQPAAQPAPNGKSTAGPSVNAKGSSAKAASQKKAPAVTAGATRAFVKHANSSQGVTEAALRQALDAFGSTTLIEVDKRKGFAYVDFAEHEGLVKAVAASPVQVAQTTVQVLERKDKKPAAAAGGGAAASTTSEKASGRGRRGRGGGGGGKTAGPTNGQAAAPAANTG